MASISQIRSYATAEIGSVLDFFLDLLRFPSLPGHEQPAIEFIESSFRPFCDRIERVSFPDNFIADPEYSFPVEGICYDNRYNLRCIWNENSSGPALLINAHVDVVPPSKGQLAAFDPRIENGIIYSRGACDDKGQIAALFLLLKILSHLPDRIDVKLILHIVVEEENGGNGTLAMVRHGEKANAAIVMEPTSNKILPSVRGAVWFKITTQGKASHSGQAGRGISALDLALKCKMALEEYHSELLKNSQGIPLFEHFLNPMPLTFGKLHSGDWPAMVPDRAILEGVLGFLPNKTRKQVMSEITDCILEIDPDMKDYLKVEFMYRHDCHVLDTDHALVQLMSDSILECGIEPTISAMPASCDSWYYNNLLNIPTVVFGAGDLCHAHTSDEQIQVEQIVVAACELICFMNKLATDSIKQSRYIH